ncbi:MAG: ice-binding family protein [Gammaproteobacteria bacterium]
MPVSSTSDTQTTAAVQAEFLRLLALIGCTGVYVDREARIEASIGSQWNVHIDRAATVAGNVFSMKGRVVLDRDATVLGDVDSAAPVTLEPGASFEGNIIDQSISVPVADIELPILANAPTGADATVSNNATINLSPGSYGKVELERGGTLALQSGIYNFAELQVERDSAIALDLKSGALVINVNERIDIGRNVVATVTMPRGDAAQAVLFQVTQGDVALGRDVQIPGTFLAPKGTISVDRGSSVEGALYAREVNIGRHVKFTGRPAESLLRKASAEWLGYENCSQGS